VDKSSPQPSNLDRRRFQQLVASAFGGLVVGSTVGCSGDQKSDSGSGTAGGTVAAPKVDFSKVAAADRHACRGLNECKGKGIDGQNACAGQGTCANVEPHGCGGRNECKNLGGCGKLAGANECKGNGGCHVPLTHEGAWDTARKHFETRMKAAGKTIGDAPPEKK
jgi:hypothetical protein